MHADIAMVCDLEDTSMLDTYFDGFMKAPAQAAGAQTEPNWTIKGTSSKTNGVNGSANGVEVQKEPVAPVV